uniref:Diphosphoinositol polyphosphate phosphohydrolase 3-beta n=1 Tax=Oryzias latipes TaxID=8090 RepID=A0A3P9J9D8_ORYLA
TGLGFWAKRLLHYCALHPPPPGSPEFCLISYRSTNRTDDQVKAEPDQDLRRGGVQEKSGLFVLQRRDRERGAAGEQQSTSRPVDCSGRRNGARRRAVWRCCQGGVRRGQQDWLLLTWSSADPAGVKGKLGRLLGIFEQNQDRKHRTYVYTLIVTETLEDWEDSVNIGRKRKWFKIDEAIEELQSHKPVHAEYLLRLADSCGPFRVYTPSTGSCPCTRVAENGASHCFVCSTQGSDLVNR